MFEEDRIKLKSYLDYFNLINSDLCVINKDLTVVLVNDGYCIRHGIEESEIIGSSVDALEEQNLFYPSVGKLCAEERKKVTIVQTNPRGDSILSTATPIFADNGELEYILCYNAIDIADCFYAPYKFDRAADILHSYIKSSTRTILKNCYTSSMNVRSKAMLEVLDMVDQVADTPASVLITGDTGVGKSLLAQIIHTKSSRANKPFMEINCGAIPETLIESELFGYEPGAFTGACPRGKKGKIEVADGGTLFLDEISEMSLDMQTKLLQVIQNKRITRVGGNERINTDFRLIAATNKNLPGEIKSGNFREDLFYRLNVIPIFIPPICDRPEDIFPIVIHFLNHFNDLYKKDVEITFEAMHIIELQKWPGNVREIENFIERLVILSRNNLITPSVLPFNILSKSTKSCKPLKLLMEEYEKYIVTDAYEQFGSSITLGKHLGISQTSAARKLRKYIDGYGKDK